MFWNAKNRSKAVLRRACTIHENTGKTMVGSHALNKLHHRRAARATARCHHTPSATVAIRPTIVSTPPTAKPGVR